VSRAQPGHRGVSARDAWRLAVSGKGWWRRSSSPPAYAAMLHEEVGDRLGPFALLEAHAAELATKPFVGFPESLFAGGVAQVCHPSRYEAVHLRDHPFERDAPVAPGDLSELVLYPIKAFRCETETPTG
jgi:hypothetical protein